MIYDFSTIPTSEDITTIKRKNYSIVKYKKANLTDSNVDHLGLFRSVIFQHSNTANTPAEENLESSSESATETNSAEVSTTTTTTTTTTNIDFERVVAFSPPKSIAPETFVAMHPLTECIIEEFIDGTMINVFWSELTNEWVLSTKSNLGATGHFFVFPWAASAKSEHTKSFREMFFDAVGKDFDFSILDKQCSYSFVLQHPMNRLVCPVTKPALYLVGMYRLHGYHVQVLDIHHFNNTHTPFRKPQLYCSTSYQDLKMRFASANPLGPTPYNVMGIIVKHPQSGHRTKFRNPTYEYVKALRGNNPRLDYRYLELRKSNQVKEFLLYYPECSKLFAEYRDKIHTFTHHLYRNYVDCYILKKNKLSYFSVQYKTNMYHLHQLYLSSLKPMGQSVSFGTVVKFVNAFEIPLLLHSINYETVQLQNVGKGTGNGDEHPTEGVQA